MSQIFNCSINIEQIKILNRCERIMKGRYLIGSEESFISGNVYADKSSLVLEWLLTKGVGKENFSIREVARDLEVSVGLVQRVFEILVFNGLLSSCGIRTAKKFYLKKPDLLLKSWIEHYSIVKKCRMHTFRSGLEKKELLHALKQPALKQKVALALHSSAEAYGFKNTNLNTLELYIIDPVIKSDIRGILQLEPQERGYEVLLVEPYYKSLLKSGINIIKDVAVASVLLTFLDLFHFPLRGQEQAEFMAERASDLKHIYRKR